MRQSAGVEHNISKHYSCERSYGVLKMLIIELSHRSSRLADIDIFKIQLSFLAEFCYFS